MKTLHVIETLGVGGAEQVLATLLPEMKRQGCECFVAVLKGPTDLQIVLEDSGIAVIMLPNSSKWNLLRCASNIAREASRLNVDLVHANLYFPAICVALARYLKYMELPTCVTFHNLAYAGANRHGIKLLAKKMLARFLYPRGIDQFTGVSGAVSEHYKASLKLSDVMVIHNPIDASQIDRLAQSTGLANNGTLTHLVLPGRIVPEKGHSVFLRACALMIESGHQFRVTIAGGGKSATAVKEEIHVLGLKDHVSITGVLIHEKLLAVMRSADIVVTPSSYEGFGLTALEAMVLSKPVVATKVGGLVDVVVDGETGCLVTAERADKLAEALISMLNNVHSRRVMGQKGRERAVEVFDVPQIAQGYLSIYAGLIAKNRQAKI